jgi:hypothetical protein
MTVIISIIFERIVDVDVNICMVERHAEKCFSWDPDINEHPK